VLNKNLHLSKKVALICPHKGLLRIPVFAWYASDGLEPSDAYSGGFTIGRF